MLRSLAICALLAVGFGLGYGVARVEDRREPHAGSGAGEPIPPAAAARGGRAGSDAAGANRESPRAAILDAPAWRTSEARDATGSGGRQRITGRILTEDGLPLSDVAIVATPGARAATTDARGAFVLDGLDDDSYELECRHPDCVIVTAAGAPPQKIDAGSHVEWMALPAGSLAVQVTRPDGSHPPSARLTFRRERAAQVFAWRPDRTSLRIPAGAWEVAAAAGDDQEWLSRPVPVLLEPGDAGAPQPLEIALLPRIGIAGRVIAEAGRLPDVVQVYVLKAPPASDVDEAALRSSGGLAHAVASEAHRFCLSPLTPGEYLIGAALPEGRILEIDRVSVANGLARHDLRLPQPERGDHLAIRATGPSGAPLRRIGVNLAIEDSRGVKPLGQRATTLQPDGTHWLRLPAAAPGASASLRLVVSAPGLGSRLASCAPDAAEIAVTFAPPASLDLDIHDEGEALGPGGLTAAVALATSRPESLPSEPVPLLSRELLDLGSAVSFGPLQPGRHVVRVVRNVPGWQSLTLAAAEVDLTPGPNRAALRIPRLHKLALDAGPEHAGQVASLQASPPIAGFGGRQLYLDGEGRARFELLPTGAYRVHVGNRSMDLKVDKDLEIRFEAVVVNALLVTIDDAQGVLARAGLRMGDVLIGVDRERFATVDDFQQLVGDAAARGGSGGIAFLVNRDGRELTVQLTEKQLAQVDRSEGGGRLTPTAFR